MEYLAATTVTTVARSLAAHAGSLGLSEMERTAIAWLAEHHVDFNVRRIRARLSAALR